MDKRKVMIVDDHPLVREGIKGLIEREPDLVVSAEATGASDAFVELQRDKPDLVIVDLALADGDGLELIERFRRYDPELKMIVVTMRDERLFGERVMRAGALGYVSKQAAPDILIDALRKTLRGEPFLSAEMVEQIFGRARGEGAANHSMFERLTNRELQVLRLIGQGLSTVGIADELHLSPKTIETHRAKIKRKLGVNSAADLVRQAVQWELSQL